MFSFRIFGATQFRRGSGLQESHQHFHEKGDLEIWDANAVAIECQCTLLGIW